MNAIPTARAKYHDALPQLADRPFLADGGLETTLIFHDEIDLPLFASYPLVAHDEGTEALRRYFESYVEIARDSGVGIVLETPTWRANRDWAQRLGHGKDDLAALNRRAVELLQEIRERYETESTAVVISGSIGPRGDGYVVGETMTADEAESYHAEQIGTFVETAVDLVTSMTMTYVEEALGIVRAAQAAGVPVVIGFTVETDGRLPSGQPLGEAIGKVDAETGGAPAYYMINCAHPSHFSAVLEPEAGWTSRIQALRANASRMSHAELDQAEELDAGDPEELAADYVALRARLPELRVLGGCCGTDHRHIDAMCRAWLVADTEHRL
jgi:S-methylmethionine-dependent homocysteine/selenocysteine methylase